MPLREAPDGFIPLRVEAVVDRISQGCGADEGEALSALAHWIARLIHAEYFETRADLKALYLGFDPDAQDAPGDAIQRAAFFDRLDRVLRAAHYQPLKIADLIRVDHRQGRLGARIRVIDEVFSHVALYGRGRAERQIEVKSLFGLRRRQVAALSFDQVMFAAHIDPEARERTLKRWRLVADRIYLKHFSDIPMGDLRTLYPTARMVMPLHSQLMLGVPALVAGVPLILKFIPQVTLLLVVTGAYLGISGTWEQDSMKQALAAAAGLGALGGFVARQYSSYDRYDLRNQREVIENAYYNKIGSNQGAFDTLISAAEEAQVKEALIAYHCLQKAPLDAAALAAEAARLVEGWCETTITFDAADALASLRRHGLVTEHSGRFQAVPIARALFAAATAWGQVVPQGPAFQSTPSP